jgi:2-polyprenyl-3-methyl-5-hydroxy-6-metoxy-1,4-benzoquinol methylase
MTKTDPIVLEEVLCDLCKSNEFDEELTGVDWEFGGSEHYRVVKCQVCGLIQQNPRPNFKSIEYIYPRSYGFYRRESANNFLYEIAKSVAQKLTAKSIRYTHLNDIKKGKILDVGCGTGSTLYPYGFSGSLECLAKEGWGAYGCEMNQEAANIGIKSGLEIKVGRLTEVDYHQDNYFDVVRFNHVLEHSISPIDDLTKAKQLTKPGGVIILSVPNINSAAYNLFGDCWSGLDLPRHFYFFTPEILTKYLDHLDLEIVCDCTDSIVADFSHSLKHFLRSNFSHKHNLTCSEGNVLDEVFHGRVRANIFKFSLQPIIHYFNVQKLGDNYTVICRKRLSSGIGQTHLEDSPRGSVN